MDRGERNSNPGNIRLSSVKFQGEVAGDDTAFKTFSSAHYGIRAIAKILLVYYTDHGINTARGAIDRWAPADENNTDAYINAVCDACGFTPDEILDFTDAPTLDKLVTAIIHQENGEVIYSSDDIASAVDDALGN